MRKRHALILSVLVGLCAVFGIVAASRTVSLGNASRATADAAIVRRSKALDRYEASLLKTLAAPPPRVAHAVATPSQPTQQPVRVVYHRPPPIVITTHRQGESGDEQDGGGFDD